MYVYLYVCMYCKYIEDRAWILNAEWIRRELSYSTPCVLASLPRSGNVCIEVCTVRHFRIDRSVFPSHGVGAVHRRCQLLRSGEDDPRILYAPPNSPWTCCIFPGILVLMDFVLLSGGMLAGVLCLAFFGSKITPPKNKEVVISKVEVQGCCGLLYAVFSTPFDVLGSITYQPSPSERCASRPGREKSPNRVI